MTAPDQPSAESVAMVDAIWEYTNEFDEAIEARAVLLAHIAKLEANDRRYRWIREPQEHCAVEWEDENDDGWTDVFFHQIRDGLDALIDAALAAEQKGE